MHVREVEPSDFETILPWYDARRGWSENGRPTPGCFSKTGFLIEQDGVPVSALWYYPTVGSDWVLVTLLVTNPKVPREESRKLAQLLIDLTRRAIHSKFGAQAIIAVIGNERVEKLVHDGSDDFVTSGDRFMVFRGDRK